MTEELRVGDLVRFRTYGQVGYGCVAELRRCSYMGKTIRDLMLSAVVIGGQHAPGLLFQLGRKHDLWDREPELFRRDWRNR